ncbi:MAG: methylmalonyl Co-A mutase-associated GTPase MeaB [Myxococcales bacterium]|nr:methylmalonyl Co-A mutase-associated GTPase MeaB [Myxococcales bacterium]
MRVGITGVPGVGKSTFIDQLGGLLCDQGHRVAVLAIDPSSKVRGGSILGDKTRMTRLSNHPNAYVRPSPTSGNLGGVHRRTRESIRVVEAAGYDIVLVETVGVGQSETTVADMVDTFVVLMLAGAGDELQGIKKGILEVADLLAINKADGDNILPAKRARSRYASALRLVRPTTDGWRPRVLTCSGQSGEGVEAVWQAVLAHRQEHEASGALQQRRQSQDLAWMWAVVETEIVGRLRRSEQVQAESGQLEKSVRTGATPPTLAAWRILDAYNQSVSKDS